jgi:putative CocE/NonD family hydrolase
MVGASYQGFSQYATAAERPAALRAIFPEIAGFDDYTSMFNPGGIPNIALSAFASASIVRDDLNYHEPYSSRPRYPSAPVVDEDGDGDLTDEIPLDVDGSGSFLDDGKPTYADGKPRQDIYYRATAAHRANLNLTVDMLLAAPHRDSKVGRTPYDFRQIDPSDRAQRIAASRIAVYNRGGWFDYHARDTVMWHATLAGHLPTYLMMAPTGHGSFPATESEEIYRAGPYFKLFGDRQSTKAMLNEEKLRFFDRYVRGVDNGFDKRSPVRLYVMNRGWRDEAQWPLAREQRVTYRFDAGGAMTTARVPKGSDRYIVDAKADSLSKGANRWNYGISSAPEPMTLDAPVDRRLHYTTAALAADTEVTGHPVLTVTLSSTASGGDLYAYLEDVGPDGKTLLVTEGELRLHYPMRLPVQAIAGVPAKVIAVKPALPWHGYAKQDFVAEPLRGGKPLSVTLDLMPTAWVFKAGHRIRLSLAGADAPSFALHPSLQSGPAPVWTIQRGKGLSELVLPVIPAADGTTAVQR